MGSVEKFEINLEHDIDEQYQYEPGEPLRGHVLLSLSGPVKIKAIQVQIRGEATVSWEEDTRNPITYRADETYIDVTQNLTNIAEGDSLPLDKGKHRFPLEYFLPVNLPSSFIGKFGSITYVVKATLREDKKFGLNTLITSEPFLVLRKLDISMDPDLNEQVEVTQEKRLWGALAFCLSGKVFAKLTVNKSGHLPGEDIFMDAEISNSSPRIVKAVQASIVMHSTFHAKNNSRHNTQIVNKKRDEWEMSYMEGRRWKGVRLTIPPYIPESRLDGCDIVDIRYELLFRVEISGGNEMKILIPITVGTAQGGAEKSKNYGRANPHELTTNKSMNGGGPPAQTTADSEYMEPQGLSLPNGTHDMEDVELDLIEEDENFRRPMEPGTIRYNPLSANLCG